MSDKILVNKNILELVPWYERDGLPSYIDQLKYEDLISDLDKHLEKEKVINFEIIHVKCRRAPKQYSDHYYQTNRTSDVQKMSQKKRKRVIGACLRSKRKDIFVKK